MVINRPPQRGFFTMSALIAAKSVLITAHPRMHDVLSMFRFLLMSANPLGVVADAGGNMNQDGLRNRITRYDMEGLNAVNGKIAA